MRITKEQLKQIIKEELESVLEGHQSNDMTQFGLRGPGDWGAHGPGGKEPPPSEESEIAQIISFNLDSGTVDAAVQQLENAQYLYDDVSDYYQTLTDESVMRFVNAILNDMEEDVHPGYHEY
tara:strand:- start:1403 stop:1768 length:366 start_codon:yes stop_codon:yes gene_type:complete